LVKPLDEPDPLGIQIAGTFPTFFLLIPFSSASKLRCQEIADQGQRHVGYAGRIANVREQRDN
jgi:hypothetical protein